MPLPVYKTWKDDSSRVSTYQDRISAAERHQDEWRPGAEEMISRYAMRHKGRYTPKGHHIRSTTSLGVLDTLFSNLTAVDVTFLLQNLANGTPLQAKIAEKAVQDAWNEQKGKKKTDKAVKDGALVGIGFNKTFYDFFETDRTVERDEEEIDADIDRLFDEAEMNGMEPPPAEMIPSLIPLTKEVTEVIRDRAVIEYVPWKEVLWDYNADDWDDLRWIVHVKRLPKTDLLGDPDIIEFAGKKAVESIEPDTVLDKKYLGDRDATEDDELCTVYEVWDFEAGDVVLIPKDKQFILKKSINCFGFNDDLEDRNPFVPILTRRDPENVRGISDMAVLAHLTDEEEVYRSNLATYIERLKPKVLGPAEAMGPDGQRAMESQEWGVYVPLEDATGADIMPLAFPQMPSEAFGMLDRIKDEAREATGVNEFMRGLMASRRTTATEVNAVDGHSNSRHSEKLNALEAFYTGIARRLLWIIQRYYDEERVLRIAGIDPEDPEAGAEETIWDWSAEDIAAEMDLRVQLVPKEPITQQTRRDQAMWALEVLPLVEGVDKREVVRWAAEQMGMDPRIVSKFIKTDAELQQEALAAAQMQAAEVQAADGTNPDPSAIPGPMAGDELAAAVNGGELPADMPIPEA